MFRETRVCLGRPGYVYSVQLRTGCQIVSLIRSKLFENLISHLCFAVVELYVEHLYISWSLISTMQF